MDASHTTTGSAAHAMTSDLNWLWGELRYHQQMNRITETTQRPPARQAARRRHPHLRQAPRKQSAKESHVTPYCTHIKDEKAGTVCAALATHAITVRVPLIGETTIVHRCRTHTNWLRSHGGQHIVEVEEINHPALANEAIKKHLDSKPGTGGSETHPPDEQPNLL